MANFDETEYCDMCEGEGCEYCTDDNFDADDVNDDFPMSLEYDDDNFHDYDISYMEDF